MSEDPTKDIEQKYDTKPTLETILLRLEEFRAAVEKRFDGLESEMNRRFDSLERKFNRLNKELLELKADHDGLDERVEKLEETRA
ncbi:MAG TPA: hypothetical protein VGB73_07570 [Pyrinomonadaceae bacterium]|jgi:predicted nuclease with TOPRIM domain